MTIDNPANPPELPDEAARIATLKALAVLDTEAEPALDVITTLAADRFNTEIALVSLVDSHRQWFKSRHGLAVSETPRNVSFCAHAITSDAIFVVPDAKEDPRFAGNPLVLGAPFIRFYAAAPLVAGDGQRIGTLCVIDSKPRAGFAERDRTALALMAGQVMDVLESAQLRRDRRISQLIDETTTDAFVCSDAESRITLWNRAAERMFGWTSEEAVGQQLDLIIPNRHRHGHNSGMERLRLGGPIKLVGKTVEVPATRRDGAEIPVELSLAMWPASGEGNPEGFAAIIRDVSARKALEVQRAEAEARMAQQIAAIQASNDGIAVTDADGRFTFMNEAHAAMFGYPDAAALIGQPWSTLYDETRTAYLAESAMPVLTKVGIWRGELQGRRADGSAVDQEVSLSLSADGGIVCVTRDISKRLLMEREKARLREQLMLAQRQEAVGQLASGIAHDFNNLIAAISGTAGLLEEAADERVRQHAQRIQSAATTATGLVGKLLGLGRRTRDPKPIDLRAVLTNVRDLVAPSLADPRHRITLDVPAAPFLAFADDTELMQVLLNLVLNARDSLPTGQPGLIELSLAESSGQMASGQVMVGTIPDGPAARISVRDTGCGIAPNEVAQVFEPFFTRKGDAGTGLGLAVVAGIVAEAGAAIALSSEPGAGTLFEIFWPLQALAEQAGPPDVDMAPESAILSGKAVLVVDDNPAVIYTLVAMLEEAGAEPGPCLDPRDALAALREDPQAWDLVITDYDMPGMNGAELAHALRAVRPDLPVMLLSALPRARMRRKGEADPFDAVLAKPAGLDALSKAARLAMAVARGRHQ
jgi:PAS domain S-box-containing protein